MRALRVMGIVGLLGLMDPGSAYEQGGTLVDLARLVEARPEKEAEVLATLQKSIDAAKDELAAYRPVPPEKIRKRFDGEDLVITVTAVSVSDVAVQSGPIIIEKRAGEVRFTCPAKVVGEPRESQVVKTSNPEGAAFTEAHLGELLELALVIAAAPPPCAETAEATPLELLEWGRRHKRNLGGAGAEEVLVKLESGGTGLTISHAAGAGYAELTRWIEATEKALRAEGH